MLRPHRLTRRHVLDGVSLTVRPGEVVGLGGLLGTGRTETARAVVGALPLAVCGTSGLLPAGLAGALNAARLSSGVTILGIGLELDAIAAVVIGGTLLTGGVGGVTGTVAGVLLLGVIQNLINQVGNLTSAVQQVVSGAFLVLVVVAQRVLSSTQRLT